MSLSALASTETQAITWASPAQGAAFQYGPFPQCASGGWGSGKTYVYCLKALWLSDTFAKNRGVIARRVAKELRATTQSTFYKICPPRAYQFGKRNDQDGLLKLNNGSEILFLHFEDPAIQTIIKGLEINWFFIDQAEESPETMEEVFDLLLGRLGRWDVAEVPEWLIQQEAAAGRPWKWFYPSSGKPMPPPYAMLAVNPDTELHWIYRRFHPESPEHQAIYKPRGYKLFEIHTLDNQFLPEINKENLLNHEDAFVRRNVYGQWGYAEGTIHVIPAESMVDGSPELLDYFRSACTLHRFLDHGDTSPTCCLWAAVDRDGNVFFYREYYLPNALISTHRQNITALSEGERYEFNLADPSIFYKIQKLGVGRPSDSNKEQGGRWSVADEYADVVSLPRDTALFWSPADNNELGTRNRINEYLRVDPNRIHPITRQRGSPRIFFVRSSDSYPQGCFHVIREVRSQKRVKVGTDLGRGVFSDERDESVPDHAYDCLRYCIASRPPVAFEAQPKAGGKTFFGKQQQLAKYQAEQARRRA